MTDGRAYFADYGLKALTAARALLAQMPLRVGVDGHFWGYRDGLWFDAEKDLHRLIGRLLGERYRPHHGQAVRDLLRGLVDDMAVEPAGRYVNFQNGMVQWDAPDAPERLPHHEAYDSTVQLPLTWSDDGQCVEFDAFIDASVAADDRQRVWEIIGYLMMSGNPLQRMFLLTGPGGNGKGVLLHVIMCLLGRQNVANVPLHAFINDRFAPARLFNKLANVCGDIDTTFIEQTGLIKELAGEDLIDGERKYGQPFQFEFWGKSIFSANGIPASADATVGWTRRWEVVDFPNTPLKPDPGLKRRLRDPASLRGIATKAIAALRDLMVRGTFAHGASALRVHEEFAQKSNKVLLWIDDTTWGDPTGFYDRRELLKRFRLWDAFENPAARPMGSQTFYERLRGVRSLREVTRQGVRGFVGLRFKTEIAYGEVIDGSTDSNGETAPAGKVQNGYGQETLL